MGRIFTVPFTGIVTAAGGDTDLLEALPADDKPITLLGWRICQTSEVKDAEEEGLRITVRKMTGTITSGTGTAVTPVDPQYGATAGFTAECNGATVATTTGSNTIVEEIGWINRNTPYEFFYPDGRFAPKARQTEGLFMRLETTLADDATFQLTFWVEEE